MSRYERDPDTGLCRWCGFGELAHFTLTRTCHTLTMPSHNDFLHPPYNHVEDSGKREEFSTGSVRDTREGKGRFDLIPTVMLRRLALHYENGAKKYGDNNWQKGQPLSRYLDSAFRHWCKVRDNLTEEDHAAAVIWNIAAYMWTKDQIEIGALPIGLDDIGHTARTRAHGPAKDIDPGRTTHTIQGERR